eukprot:2498121-Amphidinium_carterae.1
MSVNEASSQACCVGSSYHYYYYYYAYPQLAFVDSQPACVCSYGSGRDVPEVSKWSWSWQLLLALWCTSFFTVLVLLSSVSQMIRGGMCRVWNFTVDALWAVCRPLRVLRPAAHACAADVHEAWLACLFAWCAVVLILARRIPCCKQCLRRHALRHRPYAASHVASGEPLPSPGSSIRVVRRPLVAIQMDQQAIQAGDRLIQGGRWAGGRRFPQHRPLRWRTCYNPSSACGDCLFMTLSKLMRYDVSALCLRKGIQTHAVSLIESGVKVLPGVSLLQLLAHHRVDPVDYVARLADRAHLRWGNSIDVVVASHLYDLRFRIVDLDSLQVVLDVDAGCSLSNNPPLDIGYVDHHFVGGALSLPRRVHGVLGPLLAGGALSVHAGTGRLEHPLVRPFEVSGVGWDGSRHIIGNGQDCAILTAAHGISSRHHPPRAVPSPRDVLEGLNGIERITVQGRLRTSRLTIIEMSRELVDLQLISRTPELVDGVDLESSNSELEFDSDFGWHSPGAPGTPRDPDWLRQQHYVSRPTAQQSSGANASFLPDPTEWFTIHSNPDVMGEDADAISVIESASGSDLSWPSIGPVVHFRSLRSIGSDFFQSDDSLDTSRMVSFPSSPRCNLDGAIQFVREDSGFVSAFDMENFSAPPWTPTPSLRQPRPPPSVVSGDPSILSRPPISRTSSLAVSVPQSPRSDMGGTIGTAYDLRGNWFEFDIEERMPWLLEPVLNTPPPPHPSTMPRSFFPGSYVQGGAKDGVRRPYPFGPLASLETASGNTDPAASSATRAVRPRATSARQPPEIVLTYHGSFAPFHIGHCEGLRTALRLLSDNGVVVRRVAIGFTSEQHVLEKASDCKFLSANVRSTIVKELLAATQDLAHVVVDDGLHATSYLLAAKYAISGCRSVYLVGSDVMKKPSEDTLVVTRSTGEVSRLDGQEFFDPVLCRGLCIQRTRLNVNSTTVREVLAAKRMPLFYPAPAQEIIRATLGWRRRTIAHSVAKHAAATAEAVPSDAPSAAAHVLQEPSTAGNTVAAQAVDDRPPLPRKRPAPAPAVTPALQVVKQRCESLSPEVSRAPPVLPPDAARATVQESARLDLDMFNVPIPPHAHRLASPGVMKWQAAIKSNLASFWHVTALPLCQLLAVTPLSVYRRAEDGGTLRVLYIPQMSPPVPCLVFTVLHQLKDVYSNLAQLADHYVNCVWVSLNFSGLLYQDQDPDTDRGAATRMMIETAVKAADKRSLLSSYPACFVMLEADNLIIL